MRCWEAMKLMEDQPGLRMTFDTYQSAVYFDERIGNFAVDLPSDDHWASLWNPSPRDLVENWYTVTQQFNFETALRRYRQGMNSKRLGWSTCAPARTFMTCFAVDYPQDRIWHDDILATDWVKV